TGAAAGAVGPVLGGWLIDIGSWRFAFLINLPLAFAAIWLATVSWPPDRQEESDPPYRAGA
ncbi:MAG TPA: MFS transporter, partial [Afipia sp.]|nr:MFS transporter [Afipia sp.]